MGVHAWRRGASGVSVAPLTPPKIDERKPSLVRLGSLVRARLGCRPYTRSDRKCTGGAYGVRVGHTWTRRIREGGSAGRDPSCMSGYARSLCVAWRMPELVAWGTPVRNHVLRTLSTRAGVANSEVGPWAPWVADEANSGLKEDEARVEGRPAGPFALHHWRSVCLLLAQPRLRPTHPLFFIPLRPIPLTPI